MDEMKKKDRDVPASGPLAPFPTRDRLAASPDGSTETSVPTRATEGGRGDGDCGNCPSCLITTYLQAHDFVVTEVVHIAEGVWLGPAEESFNPVTYEIIGPLHDGIGVIAIESDNDLAQAWWSGQKALAILAEMGLLG